MALLAELPDASEEASPAPDCVLAAAAPDEPPLPALAPAAWLPGSLAAPGVLDVSALACPARPPDVAVPVVEDAVLAGVEPDTPDDGELDVDAAELSLLEELEDFDVDDPPVAAPAPGELAAPGALASTALAAPSAFDATLLSPPGLALEAVLVPAFVFALWFELPQSQPVRPTVQSETAAILNKILLFIFFSRRPRYRRPKGRR